MVDIEVAKNLKSQLIKAVEEKNIEINLEHPTDPKFGDYSTNIAMVLAKQQKTNPNELAEKIISKIKADNMIEKLEVAGNGFINVFLKEEFLKKEAEKINYEIEFKKNLGKYLAGKKYLLEHTSPEPTKTLHIGHFRNNFLGLSVHNILEILGAEVTLDCIDNDRGMKLCKTIWGYLAFGDNKRIASLKINDYADKLVNYNLSDEEITKISEIDWKEKAAEWFLNKSDWLTPKDLKLTSDKFDNMLYSPSQKAGELSPSVATDFQDILKAWEDELPTIREVWKQIIDWSHEGYDRSYKRIGSFHDQVWHESDFYKLGKEWVEKGLEKGVFKKLPDGGVLTDLEKFGLTDTIVTKRDGTSMYLTQDLQLTYQKVNKYPADKYIWDIGNDQSLYLKQMFRVCDQLGIVSVDKLFHLNYGFISLKGEGKMSSRFGGVINGDDLLDELKEKVKVLMKNAKKGEIKKEKEIDQVSEILAVGACKFGFLKSDRERDMVFDIDKSVSLEGDSGPYLQYTYARCRSVLSKTEIIEQKNIEEIPQNINVEEMGLIREFYKFEEKIIEASERFNPGVIAEYLLTIARKYNEFYGKHRIIGEPEETWRIFLTKVTSNVLKIGLGLLGIETVEKM